MLRSIANMDDVAESTARQRVIAMDGIYYDLSEESEHVVRVLAVGVKRRNRLRMGKETVKL